VAEEGRLAGEFEAADRFAATPDFEDNFDREKASRN